MKRALLDLSDGQLHIKRSRVHSDDGDSAYISQGSTSPDVNGRTQKLRSNQIAASVVSTASTQRPKTFHCTFDGCDKAFDRPARLEIHLRSHTKERPFVCDEPDCGKTFVRSEHLKAHIKSKHSDQRDYICTFETGVSEDGEPVVCGKSFHTGTRLRRHLAAHEEKEQTKCQECGQIFRKQETLQRHIRAAHLHEDAYRCTNVVDGDSEQCGQTFATVGQLKAHEAREHSGSRYFCDLCPRMDGQQPGFTHYSELQQHLKTVHPPTCGLCGYIAASNRNLKAHMEIVHQTLADRQRFECTSEGCDRKFTKKGNLNVHIQTVHAHVKAFVCGQHDLTGSKSMDAWSGIGCGMSFSSKAGLEQHVRTQHLGMPAITAHKAGSRPSNAQPTTAPAVAGITGHGYDETRPIACLEVGCETRFRQDHDLVIHLELHHGWNIDDINDTLAEVAALEGDKFWIGGFEEMQDALQQSMASSHGFSGVPALPYGDAMEIDPDLIF